MYKQFPYDIAFAVTTYKLQGLTIEKDSSLMFMLPKSGMPLGFGNFDFRDLYIILSRAKYFDSLRVIKSFESTEATLTKIMTKGITNDIREFNKFVKYMSENES